MRTYFIGHALYLVPHAYKAWASQTGIGQPLDLLAELEPQFAVEDGMGDRVSGRVDVDQMLRSVDAQARGMLSAAAVGDTTPEIASDLGISVSKVKTDMMRARRRVRRLQSGVGS